MHAYLHTFRHTYTAKTTTLVLLRCSWVKINELSFMTVWGEENAPEFVLKHSRFF